MRMQATQHVELRLSAMVVKPLYATCATRVGLLTSLSQYRSHICDGTAAKSSAGCHRHLSSAGCARAMALALATVPPPPLRPLTSTVRMGCRPRLPSCQPWSPQQPRTTRQSPPMETAPARRRRSSGWSPSRRWREGPPAGGQKHRLVLGGRAGRSSQRRLIWTRRCRSSRLASPRTSVS
jgi:hypothetical protein